MNEKRNVKCSQCQSTDFLETQVSLSNTDVFAAYHLEIAKAYICKNCGHVELYAEASIQEEQRRKEQLDFERIT